MDAQAGISRGPKQAFDKNSRNDRWGADDEGNEYAVTCFGDSKNAYCDELIASTNKLSTLLAMLEPSALTER